MGNPMEKTITAFFGIFGIWFLFCSYVTFTEQSNLYSESYEQAVVEFKAKCNLEGNKLAYMDTLLHLSTLIFCENGTGERTMLEHDSPITLAGVSLALMEKLTFGLVDKNSRSKDDDDHKKQ